MIITGDEDRVLTPKRQAIRLAHVLPHARLIVLHHVGHMVHYARPERVVAALADLAKEVGSKSGAAAAPPAATARP